MNFDLEFGDQTKNDKTIKIDDNQKFLGSPC
jgi:hypothetical protein